ncbi:MAG: hypothetical protein D6731_19770 [Planctomycetota bacterium]|nr:MAG: hypothetical protein D6731_19770 [Planctomycetota bacterium]
MGEATPVETTAQRVSEFLEGAGVSRVSPTVFAARRGSAVVAVEVFPWEEDEGPGDAIVEVRANVVSGALPTLDLLRQLMEYNASADFGAFGIEEGGMITFHHCLVGSNLSRKVLHEVVREVAAVADDWDDIIVEQVGGKTAVDLLSELRQPKLRPTIEAPRQAPGEA